MKAVMISIQPKWCEKILNGEKTIDVRLSMPKGYTCKGYIYCTKNKPFLYRDANNNEYFCDSGLWRGGSYEDRFLSGKVIGECRFHFSRNDWLVESEKELKSPDEIIVKETCLTERELFKYSKGKTHYFWHISELKIYDKPKELNEFETICETCKDNYDLEKCCECKKALFDEDCAFCGCDRSLTRPPQSWCYCEELEEKK